MMKDEYDFSGGERGKFFKEGANLRLPVYLEDDVRRELRRRAEAKGKPLNELVNELLRRDLALVRAVE